MVERGAPFLYLDLLMMGFARNVPAYGVDLDTPDNLRGEQPWPVVRVMSSELAQTHGPHVGTDFLGCADGSPEDELREVRAFGGEPSDRVADLPDERVLGVAASNVDLGALLRRECAALGLPYFDTPRAFSETLEAAFRTLSDP